MDGSTTHDEWANPSHVAGYVILEILGRGGFGIVYRARDDDFNRDVAVKVLDAKADADAQTRFNRERRAIGPVSNHPNIVDVYTSGVDELARPYLVMELMPRGSLSHRIERRGPLSWARSVEYGVALAGALQSAHRVGVLHRDVKPENVLLSEFNDPQLADFGIATIKEPMSQTVQGPTPLSPLHAAPEVILGRAASEASDVYSLASTVYAMIAGRAAFEADDDEYLPAVLLRVTTSPVPDLRDYGAPGAVWDVIDHAMSKDPSDRPRSAADFGDALRDAEVQLGRQSTPMRVIGGSDTTTTNLGGYLARHPVRVRVLGGPVRRFESKVVIHIGRAPDCDVQVPDRTGSAVSRHHAQLERQPDGWVFMDAGSTCGSFVGRDQIFTHRLEGSTVFRLGPEGEHGATVVVDPLDGEPSQHESDPTVGRIEISTASGSYSFRAGSQTLVLGRDPACDVVIDHPEVSRRHAVLRCSDGRWILESQGGAPIWLHRRERAEITLEGDMQLVFGSRRHGAEIRIHTGGEHHASIVDRVRGHLP